MQARHCGLHMPRPATVVQMAAWVAGGRLLHRRVEALFLLLRDRHVPPVFDRMPQASVTGSESRDSTDAAHAAPRARRQALPP